MSTVKKSEIEKLLRDLGVQTASIGFYYLRDAIETVCTLGSPTAIVGKVFALIYEPIARKYNTTTSRVERDMRNAKNSSFDRCDPRTINQFFSRNVSRLTGVPTNSEYISSIAIYLLNQAEEERRNEYAS